MLSAGAGGDRKRRRIAIACNECRDRKRKCDGVKPVCGTCAKRSSTTPCVWEEGRNAKGWSHSYVQSLRSRIQRLEQGQAMEEDNNVPHREERREVPSTPSPRQPIPQEGAESEDPRHTQARKPPGMVDMLPRSTMRASGTDHSWPPSTGRGSRDATASVVVDRHSIMGHDEADDEAGIDAMGVFGSIGDKEGQRHDFFGPSSTLRFLSHARRAMSQSTAGADRAQQRNALLGLFQDEGISVAGSSNPSSVEARKPSFSVAGHHLSIPPRSQADALLDNYWTYFHSLYPVLHRPSFIERYLTLWAPSSDHLSPQSNQSQHSKGFYTAVNEKLFHCLLNLTFALGTQFGTAVDDGDRHELGRIFFKRAKALIDFDMLARGDIFLVQMLILLGHYLQSTDMASACWNMVGLAIRVAQGIGLHHEPDYCEQGCCSKGMLSQLETEMRRRAWTSCSILDRVFSMTYGRPLMIPPTVNQHSISPSAIDDELLSDDPTVTATQPRDTPSLTECYVQAVKLQNILGDVLHTLYYGTGDKESGDISFNFMAASAANDKLRRGELQMLLNIDNSLSAWERDLPDYLKARSYNFMGFEGNDLFGPRTPAFNRQAIILHTRYLHVRLLMFRPVLSALFHSSSKENVPEQDSSMESAMRNGMLDKGVNLCVSSARDLVELITGNLDLCCQALPPSWHIVFYMHSCSIVFLICRLCCLSRIQNKEGLIASWNKCLTFFRNYQSRSRSAKRCLRIIEAIQTRVFQAQPDMQPAPASAPSSDKGPTGPRPQTMSDSNWYENIPLPDQNSSPPFFDDAVLADQATANWISDPSEMNWLSFFPFVEGMAEGVSEPQLLQTPFS